MSEITTIGLREKNQITIPSKMVREMGVKAGEELLIFESGGRLTIVPKSKDIMAKAGFLGKDDTKDFKELLFRYRRGIDD